MDKKKLSLKIDKKVINKIRPDSGLYITLKKTDSCCSVLVEPKIEILSLGSIDSLENANKAELHCQNECTIAFDKEIFDIYPKQTSFEISMARFPIRKPKVNIPVEMVSKDACK